MALEPVYCRGARGDVVAALQGALQKQKVPGDSGGALEPALTTVNGDFGIAMQRAVQRVQHANNLLMTGVVDAATWTFLMGAAPWPPVFERLLYVIAGFEGHFYAKATGDRAGDRVGMTWGLIGFTLVQKSGAGFRKGSLCTLLTDLFAKQRTLMVSVFGTVDADRLEKALKLSAEELHTFAVDQLSTADGSNLKSPWKERFEALGGNETVREMQREAVQTQYYQKAEQLAQAFGNSYGMNCERTLLYFLNFSINGGDFFPNEKRDAEAAIKQLIAASPDATVAQKLQCITDVLVASRNAEYRDDMRERMGTLAHGYGYVHGKFYRLEGWAVDVAEPVPAAPKPDPLRLAVLGLDSQAAEQIALARATHNLALAEEAGVAGLAQGRFPERTGYELLTSGGTRTVSLRQLAAKGAALINPLLTEQYEAAQMLFRGRVGVLAIFGTITRSVPGTRDHYVLQRAGRTYAGLALKSNDQLMLIRQRTAGSAASESVVDITDLRRGLSDCALILLYSGNGVPVMSLPGSGPRWREWVAATGARPLVLGWFGNVRPPQDSQKLTLANDFFNRVGGLDPHGDLISTCRTRPMDVIEQWGQACHAVFSKTPQKSLWLEEPISKVEITARGAAAIGPDGQVWRANPDYAVPGQPAMIRG
jgi:hypothetical protein